MTEGQKLLRKFRWRYRAIFAVEIAVSFAIAFACTWTAAVLFHWALPFRFILGISGLGAMCLHFVYGVWSYRRSKPLLPSTREIVPLAQFLSEPEAIIAPNFPEVSADLQRWLVEFSRAHGANSIFVSRERDEPNISDTVFLITSRLSKEEEQTIVDFHADSISTLSATQARGLFPEIPSGARVYSVLWD